MLPTLLTALISLQIAGTPGMASAAEPTNPAAIVTNASTQTGQASELKPCPGLAQPPANTADNAGGTATPGNTGASEGGASSASSGGKKGSWLSNAIGKAKDRAHSLLNALSSGDAVNTGGSAANALTLQNALMLSQMAKGNELTDDVYRRTAELKATEDRDRSILENRYKDISVGELDARLKRAEGELSRLGKYMENGTMDGINQADQARFRNTLFNAADKARIAQDLLNEGEEGKDGKEKKLSQDQIADLLAKLKNPQDSVIDRLLMLNGLLEKEKEELLSQLSLNERVRVVLPDGQIKMIPLLHSGYLNSKGQPEMDCPTFIAATLSPRFRKANLTTMDLRGIWSISRTGELPKGIQWGKGREETLRKVARGFEAVNLYTGEEPQPGDLIVNRIPWEPNGRVVIVKKYDPKRKIAQVAEPSSDGSHLTEFDFQLSVDPPENQNRHIRPGLVNLRLIPEDSAACRYENKRSQKSEAHR